MRRFLNSKDPGDVEIFGDWKNAGSGQVSTAATVPIHSANRISQARVRTRSSPCRIVPTTATAFELVSLRLAGDRSGITTPSRTTSETVMAGCPTSLGGKRIPSVRMHASALPRSFDLQPLALSGWLP